jgi:hypothetical protein
MERANWAGVRAIVLAVTSLFLLPIQAQAERDWELSVGGFGGEAYHSNQDIRSIPGTPVHRFMERYTVYS